MSQIGSGHERPQEDYQEVQIGPEKLKIPEEWTVTALGDVATKFISGGTPDSGNEDYWGGDIPWTTAAVVEGPKFEGEKDFITQKGLENSSASLVPKGGVLFGTRVNVANVGITTKDIAISQDLTGIILDENKVDPNFVTWYLLLNQAKIRDRYSQGSTIQGMLTDDLKSLPLLSPSLSEQRRIADILSTVHKEIEQTNEKTIQHSDCRRGVLQNIISGNGPKHTKSVRIGPVEYDLPSNWEVYNVEELLADEKKSIRGGPAGSRIKKEDRSDSGFKLYFQENVIKSDFTHRDDYITEEKFQELSDMEPIPGDILVTLTGNVGECAVFPEDAERGIYESNVMRIRVNDSICLPEYLSELLDNSKIIDDQIRAMSHGGTRKKINNKIVKSISVPVPPIKEQEKITKILLTFDNIIDIENTTLEKQKELKRGLMQDLLTGKVRVDTD